MNRHVKKAVVFIGLTFLVNWSLALLFFALGGRWYTPAGMAIGVAYMFVPMGMAFPVQRGICREPIREPLAVSFRLNRWFLLAWLLPPVVAFATLGVSLLMPGVEYSPQMQGLVERFESLLTAEQMQQLQEYMAKTPIEVLGLALLGGLIAGVTVNAVAGFGEELGWRGLLQKELAFLGFWRSSVLAAAIVHGTLNATYGLSIVLVRGGNDLTTGVTGLPGFVVLAAVILILWLHDSHPQLREENASSCVCE